MLKKQKTNKNKNKTTTNKKTTDSLKGWKMEAHATKLCSYPGEMKKNYTLKGLGTAVPCIIKKETKASVLFTLK